MNETTPLPPMGPNEQPSSQPSSYGGPSFQGAAAPNSAQSSSHGGPAGPHPGGTPVGPPPAPPPGHYSPPQPNAGRPRRGLAAVVVAALAAGILGGGVGAAATYAAYNGDKKAPSVSSLDQPSKSQNASVQGESDVQSVAKKVLPSTVFIQVKTPRGVASGSGVIVSSDGQILTNNHVASAASENAELTVSFNDHSTAKAKVVGMDPITDLAVIQAEDVSGLQPASLGASGDLGVGQNVIAIGSPLGLTGTVTQGIVSSLHRPVNTGTAQIDGANTSTVIDAIQTDAAINHGNSGGALVNGAGQVVGINTAIASAPSEDGTSGSNGSIGIGFAIPIDQAKSVAKQLADKGEAEHAQLSVSVGQPMQGGESGGGANVASVESDGAADQAGLKKGDVITGIDDRVVDDSDALIAAVRAFQPGTKVKVTYERDGTEHTATVTLDSDGGVSGPAQAPSQNGEQQPQQPEQQPEGPGFPLPR